MEKALERSLKQLNSAPGNLNPGKASANQAIEKIRQQAKKALERLGVEFKTRLPDVASTKEILLKSFEDSEGDTPIINVGNEVRKFVRERVNNATTTKELTSILHETKTSTGIDLSQLDGSKTQTSYSFELRNEIQRMMNPDSTMTPDEKLDSIYKILETPSEIE